MDVALIPWPAREGVPKEHLEYLTVGKWQPWTPIKNYGCGLDILACKGRGTKGIFGAFEPGKWQPWTPIKSYGCGLGALTCEGKRCQRQIWSIWRLAMWTWCLGLKGKGIKGILEAFDGWQTVALNANKKLWMWPWYLGLQGKGCQRDIWSVWRLANGSLEHQ